MVDRIKFVVDNAGLSEEITIITKEETSNTPVIPPMAKTGIGKMRAKAFERRTPPSPLPLLLSGCFK